MSCESKINVPVCHFVIDKHVNFVVITQILLKKALYSHNSQLFDSDVSVKTIKTY